MVRIDHFDYELPVERIAQTPVEPRDAARLLVDRGPGADPAHRRVRDLPELLGPGDVVVVNRSKVLAARLRFTKPTGGAVEVLLLEPDEAPDDSVPSGRWQALVKPSRRVGPGTELTDGDLVVVVDGDAGDGIRHVRVSRSGRPVTAATAEAALTGRGEMPLPPYIETTLTDATRYQTVFATEPGSVAAPTAGLHFTDALFERIVAVGAEVAEVELHVGLDTFRPVTVEDSDDHVMHTERFHVPDSTLAACARADRVVAVGTTTVRALESAAAGHRGRTDLFITDPWPWQVVDVLMTNFHLPRSSLLLLVHAFVGDHWRHLYDAALAADYRFLSFGDAMLLTRRDRRGAAS